jgi:asparagine synthase (glutamine-hydrolysing)
MAVSVESRVPLIDTRIVELMNSMPPRMKFQGGRSKHVFRQAVAGLAPEPVMQRKDKMGFPVPLNEWLAAGPVREFARDVLLGQRSRERGFFETATIEQLMRRDLPFSRQVWGALCVELWHRRFIDA